MISDIRFNLLVFPRWAVWKCRLEWRMDAPRKATSRNGNQPHVLQRSNCYSLINSVVPEANYFNSLDVVLK